MEIGQCGKFFCSLFSITRNRCHCPKIFSSQDFSTQQHQPLPLPIGHLLSKKFRSLWVLIFICDNGRVAYHSCPSAVASRHWYCPLLLPLGHCPPAVARLMLPVSRCPSAIAHRPLPVRPSPIRHYSSAVAHHPWLLPFIHHRCLLSKEIFYGDGTLRQIFSCCLLSEFFHWDGTVRHFFFLSFVNMETGAWRWDSMAILFLSLCHHP